MRALLALLVALPCAAAVSGADKPRSKRSHEIGITHDTTPPGAIVERCEQYAGSALVWSESPALIGVYDLRVQRDCKGGVIRPIDLDGGSPGGRAGRWLYVEDEALGSSTPFSIWDLETGKKVLQHALDDTLPFSFTRGATIGARFRLELDVSCVPTSAACWERVKQQNHVTANVAAPDCTAAFTAEPSARTEPRGLAVSVPVEVPDLAKPKLAFVAGNARCEALP